MLDPKTIRNVAIIAHDGAGKTALTEALLRHEAPARASKDGSTSHLDVDPEETKRNFTVATHVTFAEHDGVLMNLLDAPGFSDFLTDADRSMAVCEGGLLLVSTDYDAAENRVQIYNGSELVGHDLAVEMLVFDHVEESNGGLT